jgi:hypothetical protein
LNPRLQPKADMAFAVFDNSQAVLLLDEEIRKSGDGSRLMAAPE